MSGGEIEVIHGFRDVKIRIGVEAIDELAAAIAQVAFDFELVRGFLASTFRERL